LSSRFEVELKPNTETRVEFRPQAPPTLPATGPAATFTPVPLPPALPATGPAAPPSQFLPARPLPDNDAFAHPTAKPDGDGYPGPQPYPAETLQGFITGRAVNPAEPASLNARMAGMAGIPIQLRGAATNPAGERRCLTGQDNSGPDSCTFASLAPGQYVVAPEGLG